MSFFSIFPMWIVLRHCKDSLLAVFSVFLTTLLVQEGNENQRKEKISSLPRIVAA